MVRGPRLSLFGVFSARLLEKPSLAPYNLAPVGESGFLWNKFAIQGLIMLRGAHTLSLDSKGRFGIPTRFRDYCRDDTAGILVCTVDIFEPCLLLYPLHEWELIEKKLRGLSRLDIQHRRLQRV